ncbi:MAG: hypothetical protein JWM59_1859 [Verrucomicrobiales bacterium]|nr:hypothetical protein [Verrucomicrobiales bacterium]
MKRVPAAGHLGYPASRAPLFWWRDSVLEAPAGDYTIARMSALLDILKLFVGPFLGASLAFYYQRHKARQDETKANRSALMKAQIVLMCHIKSLNSMRRHYLPFKNLQQRELKIVRIGHTFDHAFVDMASLSFLADHNKSDVIMKLYVADTDYRGVCSAAQERSEYRAKFDEMITVQEFDPKTGLTTASGPPAVFFTLKQHTDAMFTGIDLALRECIEASEAVRLLASELFPGSRFPASYSLPAEPPPADQQSPAA